ncbi:MAG: antibiotic biosynthesis monooxygenase [Lachnospiraceae bacterium]|nr:antibiotic biosynthesis monooxygenase [Lachnospiraceae bacterium]
MITSTARDYIRPECVDEYYKLIFELIDRTREEKGNISYTLYADGEHPGEHVLIEEWEDKESLEAHFKTEHFTGIVPKIQKLQSAPSVVNVYSKVK